MALVVFLRGINVGGHRRFRPSLLAAKLKNFGLVNIGAAGTFVVRARVSQARLRSEICRHLSFDAEVAICAGDQLLAAVSRNPFAGQAPQSDIVHFVSILARRPNRRPALPVCIPASGRWVVQILATYGRFVFGFYRREMKAIACLGEIDRLFGSPATTRSWSTINATVKMLEKSNRE